MSGVGILVVTQDSFDLFAPPIGGRTLYSSSHLQESFIGQLNME